MNAATAAATSALVVVYLVSLFSKVRGGAAFESFTQALVQFGIPTLRLRRAVAAAVISAEGLVLLALLLPSPSVLLRLGPAVLLTAVFTGAIAVRSQRVAALRCRCFGSHLPTRVPDHLMANLVLVALGTVGMALAGRPSSPGGLVLGAGMGFIIGVLVVMLDHLMEALRPDVRVMEEVSR